MKAFNEGKAKLPTPTLNLKVGSIKDHFVSIDQGSKETGYTLLPEFEEAFGALLVKKAPSTPKVKAIPTPTAVAVALNKILQDQFKK
jgi:hypothetical protein